MTLPRGRVLTPCNLADKKTPFGPAVLRGELTG